MKQDTLKYCIMDPTGNITALVESRVEIERQPETAAELMRRHPEVEQVGFMDIPETFSKEAPDAALRMAGGEFCGNASLSAAALYLLRKAEGKQPGSGKAWGEPDPVTACGQPDPVTACGEPDPAPEATVRLKVSGAAQPVEVRLRREAEDRFRGSVHMPPALGIEEMSFSFGNLQGMLPVVRMEGISHIIIKPDSVFRGLLQDREDAAEAVQNWCRGLSAEGLGLMFLDENESEGNLSRGKLVPLVYIPGSGTVFWETSCASGSSAAGMYLAAEKRRPVRLELQEPGGILYVESRPREEGTAGAGETWLSGSVRLTGTGTL